MQVAARPHVMAGALLAAASLVAVTPIAQRTIHLPMLSIETQLIDESLLNIPMNLLADIANIPYNEVAALNSVAGSLFFGGNWWPNSSRAGLCCRDSLGVNTDRVDFTSFDVSSTCGYCTIERRSPDVGGSKANSNTPDLQLSRNVQDVGYAQCYWTSCQFM